MPILPVPITPITPRKLIPYAAGPVLPFKSSPPRPDFAFRSGHSLKKGFDFVPHQVPHHFLVLFRYNLPQAHVRLHSCFCPIKQYNCPFHY